MGFYHSLVDGFARTRIGSLLVPGRGFVPYVTHEVTGDEREHAWRAANSQYSGFTVYQGRTGRTIPVVILRPA